MDATRIALVLAFCWPLAARADSSVPPAAKRPGRAAAGCARLPAEWVPTEIAQAALGDAKAAATATLRVLAWQFDEDDRPLLVHSALVWIQAGQSWRLAHLYRHPRDVKPSWRISMVTDVPYAGAQSYARAPGRAELDRFLDDTWWRFAPHSGFRLLDAEVCADAWRATFAQPPWRRYPR